MNLTEPSIAHRRKTKVPWNDDATGNGQIPMFYEEGSESLNSNIYRTVAKSA